eukprot:5489224-Amphidinium_carterae.1
MAWDLVDHGVPLDMAFQGKAQSVGAWLLDTLATLVEAEMGWVPPDCFLDAVGNHVARHVCNPPASWNGRGVE